MIKQDRNPTIDWIYEALVFIGDAGTLVYQTVLAIVTGKVEFSGIFRQMALIGVQALPMAVIASSFMAGVITLYITPLMMQYGMASKVGGTMALVVARELGPIVTGIVVAARSASAIAAEIGTMKVTEQIDALRALSVPPVQYLVAPRVIASIIMLPVLTMIAVAAGIVGGYYVAMGLGVPSQNYILSIRDFTTTKDIYTGLGKTCVFGLIVSIVGCRTGLRTSGGATGVGLSTTTSVVVAVLAIFMANFMLAYLFFGSGK